MFSVRCYSNLIDGLKRPLTNLSPYLKSTQSITDAEEQKILQILNTFDSRVYKWDDYEEEKFRRFLEVQDPEFRMKLLYCMREHIQEVNLVDSFFVRYKATFLDKSVKSVARSHTQKEKTKLARDKVMSTFLQYERDQAEKAQEDNKEIQEEAEGESEALSKVSNLENPSEAPVPSLPSASQNSHPNKKEVKILTPSKKP